jgi:hypothetical protein
VSFSSVATRPALLAAATFLIDGRPSSPLRFVLGNAPILVTLFDVLGFAPLLSSILGLVATRHHVLHLETFEGRLITRDVFESFGSVTARWDNQCWDFNQPSTSLRTMFSQCFALE